VHEELTRVEIAHTLEYQEVGGSKDWKNFPEEIRAHHEKVKKRRKTASGERWFLWPVSALMNRTSKREMFAAVSYSQNS